MFSSIFKSIGKQEPPKREIKVDRFIRPKGKLGYFANILLTAACAILCHFFCKLLEK